VSKNVAVFVDVANIFYAAKAAGADIDYVTLLKAAVAGRDFVRAYAYTGLDPENENQRNFHSFLARHGYKVVSKDIRKYGDGKVKANLDIELVVDMMKTARNLDVAIVVSGDGDFAPAIRAVQEMGVRVEVISFRGNTSSDLIEVADAFYDITQVARVDRDSSRSGRRVAGDDEDLSMTEVPDKQTEGRGGSRGRGRGRGRGGRAEGADEFVAADSRGGRSSSDRPAPRVAATRVAASRAEAPRVGGRIVVLPGEKLSRAASASSDAEGVEEELLDEVIETMVEGEILEGEGADDALGAEGGQDAGRRRRRRGGRGRGHGRSHSLEEGGEVVEAEAGTPEEGEPVAAPAVRVNQFGSVWDSQIGMTGRPTRTSRPAAATPAPADEDDYAEPEIPEYLLAERRRGSQSGGRGRGGQGGGRGVRSAYASAVERERYGRGASSSRYPEPARQPQAQPQRHRDDRPVRQQQPQRGGMVRPPRDSNEPWSEVPPEIEELLRAQLSAKPTRPAATETGSTGGDSSEAAPAASETRRPSRSRRTAPAATAAAEGSEPAPSAEAAPNAEAGSEAPAPKKRAPARRKPAATAAAEGSEPAPSAEAAPNAEAGSEAPAPKKRAPARRKPAATAATTNSGSGEGAGE